MRTIGNPFSMLVLKGYSLRAWYTGGVNIIFTIDLVPRYIR